MQTEIITTVTHVVPPHHKGKKQNGDGTSTQTNIVTIHTPSCRSLAIEGSITCGLDLLSLEYTADSANTVVVLSNFGW